MAFQARKLLLVDIETYVPRIPASSANIEKLKKTLREGQFEFPDGSDRFTKAEKILNDPDFDTRTLEFLLNEVLAEFMRENQARGPLKYIRGNKFAADFQFFDKRYLSMIIEVSQLLSSTDFQKEIRDWEYKLCGYVEGILEKSSQALNPEQFTLSYDAIKGFKPAEVLSPEKNDWIRDNLGFTTMKNNLY